MESIFEDDSQVFAIKKERRRAKRTRGNKTRRGTEEGRRVTARTRVKSSTPLPPKERRRTRRKKEVLADVRAM